MSFGDKCHLLFISDVPAIFDIWFIGDTFLKDIYNDFQYTMNKVQHDRKMIPPFIFEYFNIEEFSHPLDLSTKRVVGRILNALIEGLNTRDRLPRFIIVVIDKDIISNVDVFMEDAVKCIRETTEWLVKQINIYIR